MSRRRALRLLNSDGFHQRPKVPVDRLLLGVDRLMQATQKHCCNDDVLASPSELWGVVSSIHDVALDLTGVTSGAARQVMPVWHNVLHRARQHRWQLALSPLSQLFTMLLCMSEGLRTRVQRGVSL